MDFRDLTSNKYKTKDEISSFISSFFPENSDLVFKDLGNIYSYAFMSDNPILLDSIKNHPDLFNNIYKEKTLTILKNTAINEFEYSINFSSFNCFQYLTKNISDVKMWQSFLKSLSNTSVNNNSTDFYLFIKQNLNNLNSNIKLNKSIVQNFILNNHQKIIENIDSESINKIIKKNITSFLIDSLNPYSNNQNTFNYLKNEFLFCLTNQDINDFFNQLFKQHIDNFFTLNSQVLKDFLCIPNIKLHKETIDNFYSLFKNAPDNPEYINMYQLISKHSLKNNIIEKFKAIHSHKNYSQQKTIKI